jgi:hypothetical protein
MALTLGNGSVIFGDGTQNTYSGFPAYQVSTPTVLTLNAWRQAGENVWVSMRLSGSYINGISVIFSTTSSGGTSMILCGDDWNTNTKGQYAGFPVKQGAWYYIESPGGFGYAYETIFAYEWPIIRLS